MYVRLPSVPSAYRCPANGIICIVLLKGSTLDKMRFCYQFFFLYLCMLFFRLSVMLKWLSGFRMFQSTQPSHLWRNLVFHNLPHTLGQEYYSVPAYPLCSFLPDVFVNKLYRYVPPSIPIFVTPLTKLVSAFVNFSEIRACVDIVNNTIHWLLQISVFTHCCLPCFYLYVSVSLLEFMTTWKKKRKPPINANSSCCLLLLQEVQPQNIGLSGGCLAMWSFYRLVTKWHLFWRWI